MIDEQLKAAIKQQDLPADFLKTIQHHFTPIALNISERAHSKPDTLIVGIQGCQGSGKTTLANILKTLLEQQAGLNAVVVSIDDFYLTRSERVKLAKDTHPLFNTRGVPGTHDIALCNKALSTLQRLSKNETFHIPRFDKSTDDRERQDKWPCIHGPVDIIILEGWCIGLRAQETSALNRSVNRLESKFDAKKIWRRYANQALSENYSRLFDRLDLLIVLLAPSFESVYQWRLLQEQKLQQKLNLRQSNTSGRQTMSPRQIREFILYFQRLTEHGNATLPQRADWLIKLDKQHAVLSSTHQTGNNAH